MLCNVRGNLPGLLLFRVSTRVAAWDCRAKEAPAGIPRDAGIRRFDHAKARTVGVGGKSTHLLMHWSFLGLALELGTETYGCCVVPIMADADEGLVVLMGTLDDSRWGALPVCVGRGLL